MFPLYNIGKMNNLFRYFVSLATAVATACSAHAGATSMDAIANDSLTHQIADSLSNAKEAIWKQDSLGEILVTGQSVKQEGDMTKVLITKELRKGTASTIQMLGKLRNFFYDYGSGELTYNNSRNIVVLVDSVQRDLSYITNIQHIRFDRIDIIDHPTGMYQGADVLINLHLKQNYQGYEGYVSNNEALNFNSANKKKLIWEDTNISASAVSGKWSFYAWAHHNFGQTKSWQTWSKEYPLNGLKEKVLHNDNNDNWCGFDRKANANISADYTIDKKRSLSFVYQMNQTGSNSYNYYMLERNHNDNLGTIISSDTLSQDIRNRSNNTEHSFGLFWRDNKRKIMYDANLNYRYTSGLSYTNLNESTGFVLDNNFKNRMNYLRGTVFSAMQLCNSKLTLNAAYIFTLKDYKLFNGYTASTLNQNRYIRNNFSFAVAYNFRNNSSLALSYWAEVVSIKSNGTKATQCPMGGNFMFFYKLSRCNWFRLNYDCSVNYPDQGMSSSYGYFTDSLTWTGGNPWLKTSVKHNVRGWLDMWNCFNFQAGYIYAPNNINSITLLRYGTLPSGVQGNYAANVYENTKFDQLWFSTSLTKRLWRDLLLKADARIDFVREKYQEFSTNECGGSFSTSMNYYSTKLEMNFNIAYSYQRIVRISPQTTSTSNYEHPSISIQKYFCGKKLEVRLTYQDMFNFFDSGLESKAASPALLQTTYDPYGSRHKHTVYATVSWRFAGGHSVRKYNRELSEEK